MNTTQLHQIMTHRYRIWIVTGIALVIVLVGGLPLTDELSDTQKRASEAQEAIHSISFQADNLPALRQRVEQLKLQAEQEAGIGEARLSEFRDECLRLIRKHGTRAENVTEGRPMRQPWTEAYEPMVAPSPTANKKHEYEVVTNSLKLTVVGELRQLVTLLEEIQQLDDFLMPIKLTIQQHNAELEQKMEIELAMVELVKVTQSTP
jgi:hypothetical protein